MNEQIKELEIQCWEPRQYGPAWFNSKKFAELIVRECAKVADDGFASSNFGNGITGHQLLKHFGVEE